MLGAIFYLTFLETTPLKTVEVQTEYLDYFTRNTKSFGSSYICVISGIYKTGKRALKLDSQLKTTYLCIVDFVFLLVTVCTCDCWFG